MWPRLSHTFGYTQKTFAWILLCKNIILPLSKDTIFVISSLHSFSLFFHWDNKAHVNLWKHYLEKLNSKQKFKISQANKKTQKSLSNVPECRNGGNDFRVSDITSDPAPFHLIFLCFSSVTLDRVDIQPSRNGNKKPTKLFPLSLRWMYYIWGCFIRPVCAWTTFKADARMYQDQT